MKADPTTAGGSDVLIIGGGLQGLSSALQLARRGCSVRLLEADYCGRHASGVNAGGVRTVYRHMAEVPLSVAARTLWHNLADLVGENPGFVASGQLKLAETEAELERLRQRVEQLNALGYTHEELVGPEVVRELVPALTPNISGAIWAADDGYAYPYGVVTAFRHACERLGVIIHEGTPADRIERIGERWQVDTPSQRFDADFLVNTAGAWAGEFARQVDEPVPLEAVGLMLMVTTRVAPFVKPVLGATGRALSFKQFANGTVVIGGGLTCAADPVAGHGEVDMMKLATSARTVTDLFPHLRGIAINRAWAGVEGFMPDHIPVISASRTRPNLVHAFGFSAHGFELSPIVGQIVAELLLDGRSTQPIAPFAIDRFAAAPAAASPSSSQSLAA
ncbi:NAD(P)/FAD-dependent oxidoreductase [Piscinibacter sakaiensis]|uniref:NAD(P)/FAD-dependent oxidoreductase n=1 Tax=Piscinibacter sakaiensis TaxID=1547922 RepID=UPI003AAC1860